MSKKAKMTGYDKKNIIIKRVYNLFILLGILMAGYLCSKQFLTKFSHMDTYLRYVIKLIRQFERKLIDSNQITTFSLF